MRAGSRSACENERAFTFWEEEKARKRKMGESHPLTEITGKDTLLCYTENITR